ncbi:hypothetical protein BKN14_04720 [Candidatus Gracilibacteria bacterium HOT-871]|nr:hypothetical protein BKN14_04720 [Candidatus Gracilibacteria bacterium HOT-871]MBB1565111.1 hypothetical protein [Candidatus Gracilibacteria bacterium]RKW21510.1 MAG: hypothetical protein D8B46_07395 [Candidatus Gracilibacteria bacterium]
MERALIEARTRKIISFMKNKNLANLLEKNISMFSDEDLTKVLEFLETGDDSVLVNFLMEKTKQFMAEAEKVKQAKSKIKKFKNQRQEQKERQEETENLENLLDF